MQTRLRHDKLVIKVQEWVLCRGEPWDVRKGLPAEKEPGLSSQWLSGSLSDEKQVNGISGRRNSTLPWKERLQHGARVKVKCCALWLCRVSLENEQTHGET